MRGDPEPETIDVTVRWPRAAMVVWLLAVLLGALPGFSSPPARAQEPGTAVYTPDPDYNYGELLRRQRKLLLEQARALAPQRPGVIDLYFIGFAGDAQQDVFRNEVLFARKLFETRFDATGRALALINSPRTMERWPLATYENLRLALNFVSHLIDRDEDMVFLFITSHGSRDHRLAVDLAPLDLKQIDAPMLKSLIDKSKIKWRVIVISACYSGGFVEPLRDPKALIISAARSDRTSFGCTNTARFTYFGRAFFVEALQLETSFVRAFDLASRSISIMERQQNFPPSQPQIDIGSEIAGRLAAFEARLNTAATRQVP